MHFGVRSLLADIIQKQDLKEHCSVLVREAAKILAGIWSACKTIQFYGLI